MGPGLSTERLILSPQQREKCNHLHRPQNMNLCAGAGHVLKSPGPLCKTKNGLVAWRASVGFFSCLSPVTYEIGVIEW